MTINFHFSRKQQFCSSLNQPGFPREREFFDRREKEQEKKGILSHFSENLQYKKGFY